jgi:hypothetical protein
MRTPEPNMIDLLPMHFLGTMREHYVLLFGTAGGIGLMAGFVGSWIGGWLGARRAVRTAQRNAPVGSDASRVQIAELARMVEAIAIEVERVSEGQRFTTRLLADRMPLSPSDARPRGTDMTTPH